MARRGFFAEMQHQAKVAAREAERAQAARVRQHAAAVREAEGARKAAERAAAQAQRASEADRKRLEKEAKEAHVAAMLAAVEELNNQLAGARSRPRRLRPARTRRDPAVRLPGRRPDVGGPREHPAATTCPRCSAGRRTCLTRSARRSADPYRSTNAQRQAGWSARTQRGSGTARGGVGRLVRPR